MAKPKLALIPAAQGSKFYSVLPSDGVGDFDFARASAATRINKYGLIETVASGQSRLNYPLIDGVVNGCPHHILEPARANLVTYSQTLSNWGQTNVVSTGNAIISPDGTLNASKITDDSVNSTHRIILSSTTSASGEATYSVFLKKGTMTTCFVNLFSSATIASASVDLENGTISGATGTNHKIEQYPNDWYRVSIQGTLANTSTFVYVYVKQLAGYIGNGDYIYAWGAQLEEGSYPTSYIVSNSGSATTRVAETANNSGDASTFNSLEGVLMAEISAFDAADTSFRYISLNDGTSSNLVRLVFYLNYIFAETVKGGVNQGTTQYIFPDTEANNKIAFEYGLNNFILWVNGFNVNSDLIGNIFSANTLTKLSFHNGSGANDFYGKTKQIQYYDSELTDSELETLTSWTSFSEMAQGQLYSIQ
jgi:hypothetical protein